MRVSIIIPAYNEEYYLEQTIPAIRLAFASSLNESINLELIVCDNGSTDRTAEIAAKCSTRVIHQPDRQISRARNTGAAIAQGEWLLFIDQDSYPIPQLIGEMLEKISNGSIIDCGSTVRIVDGTLFNKLRLEWMNPIYRLFGISEVLSCLQRKKLSIQSVDSAFHCML